MSKILRLLKNKYINNRGFHTNRRLLCIESDDWGSIRMPSKEVFEELKRLGDTPQDDSFLSNDSLEREEDLQRLYDCLSSVEDCRGRNAIITANFAMANPDFGKIDYVNDIYNYEPFYDTYKKYYPKEKVLDVVKDGIAKNIFIPQLHCREHLNVNRWMMALKEGKEDVLIAFQHKMVGIKASKNNNNLFGYMDAFGLKEDEFLEEKIIEAITIFEQTFSYKSKTFVACCNFWGKEVERLLKENGVEGLQGSEWQRIPKNNNGEAKMKLRFTGDKNRYGQIYTIRNCSYEPTYTYDPESYKDQCLKDIKNSFANKKPAIINSHRLNYIGSINEKNAEENVKYLKILLKEVLKEFPDVEFVSSPELIDIIKEKR